MKTTRSKLPRSKFTVACRGVEVVLPMAKGVRVGKVKVVRRANFRRGG